MYIQYDIDIMIVLLIPVNSPIVQVFKVSILVWRIMWSAAEFI